jgi:GNAT superfamily N-acetyltransferase
MGGKPIRTGSNPGVSIEDLDPAKSRGEILDLWNSRLGRDFPLDERLLMQNLSRETNRTRCLGAWQGKSLVGFILCKQHTKRLGSEETKSEEGNLSAIVVSPALGRTGIGTALLSRAEADLSSLGVRRLHLGEDTYHFFPGAPADGSEAKALEGFLASRGFEPGALCHDMIGDLGGIDLESLAPKDEGWDGITVGPYGKGDRAALSAFLSRTFPGRWYQDTMEALDAGMRPKDLILMKDGSTVIGFARIYDGESPVLGPGVYWRALMGGSPGGLGPIGVDEAYRGRGLGLRILHESLMALKNRGAAVTVIDWTTHLGFYGKMGFGIWKNYRHYTKDLTQGTRT